MHKEVSILMLIVIVRFCIKEIKQTVKMVIMFTNV